MRLHRLNLVLAAAFAASGAYAQTEAPVASDMTPEDRAVMERINSQFESSEGGEADSGADSTTEANRNARVARKAFRDARSAAERAASLGWECRALLEGGGTDMAPCEEFSRITGKSGRLSRAGDRLLSALRSDRASEADLPNGAMDELNHYMESVRETQVAIQRMAQGQ